MKMLSKVLASDLGESDDGLASKAHYQIFCPASFLFFSFIQLYFFPILQKLVRHNSQREKQHTPWKDRLALLCGCCGRRCEYPSKDYRVKIIVNINLVCCIVVYVDIALVNIVVTNLLLLLF